MPVVLDGELTLVTLLDGELSQLLELDGELGVYSNTGGSSYPIYDGETEVTPSEETQTLVTHGDVVTVDITINPIPSNYGLITYDGTKLVVS